MSLIRLAYASEATFQPGTEQSGVEPHVARILLASRRNNARSAVVGGLYYGNHRFFQYLEGSEEDVRGLYDRITRDSRHRHVKTLLDEPLDQRTFEDWSMKYVPQADDVQRMLSAHGMDRFEPDRFDRSLCEEMIVLIRQSQASDTLSGQHAVASGPARDELLTPGIGRGLVAAGIALLVALAAGGFFLLR